MKIEFLAIYAGENGNFSTGEKAEVEESFGKKMIRAGAAKPLENENSAHIETAEWQAYQENASANPKRGKK